MKRLTVSVLAILVCGTGLTSLSAADEKGNNDKLMMAAQKICPVSGHDLKSDEEPIKVKLNDQTFFLCCEGCKGSEGKEEYLTKIKENLIKAQGLCTVMDKPLPKDATSIVVDGREVFVCCPPCTKKIKADPKKYLEAQDALFKKNLKLASKEAAKSDS